jgi:hypothetical protein
LDCHDWFKNYKEQHSTKNNSASSSLWHKKKGHTRLTDSILYERLQKTKKWTIFLFFERIFYIFEGFWLFWQKAENE